MRVAKSRGVCSRKPPSVLDPKSTCRQALAEASDAAWELSPPRGGTEGSIPDLSTGPTLSGVWT